MSLLVSYTAVCDYCDEDAGDSRPTVEEAIDYAVRGGWILCDEDLFCENCHALIFSDSGK
jgi:hypothetical protein